MKNIRLIFLSSFILLIITNSFGQRVRYKDVKDDYSTKNYRKEVTTSYHSPLVAGVCNYLFPGLGYFYIEEPGRGSIVLGSELVTSSVFLYGLVMTMSMDSETGKSPPGSRAIMISGMIGTGLIQIWSIFDVVKIAKIKNLARQKHNVTMKLNPDLNFMSQNHKFATYGLRVSIDF